MSQGFVNIPVPDRLNLDLSPSRLDPNEAADLYNVLVHEPGQLRRRKGYVRRASVGIGISAPGQDAPIQVVTTPSLYAGGGGAVTCTRALATYATNQNGLISPYRIGGGQIPSGWFELTASSLRGVFFNADSPTSVTASACAVGTIQDVGLLPFTQQTMYDSTAIWTSACRVTAADKNGNANTRTRLVRWAGTNNANTQVWVTINNGATTGTIWTNAGGTTPPASSLAGMFLTVNADPNGTHYNYLITSHTAGSSSFTILKPYGLGASTGTIPNRTLSQGITVSYAIVQNAPPGSQCAISHYDRVFVGRPDLVNAVGVFPVGSYMNSIAWSDAGEPEKWTDTNFIQINGNPSDAIMGFAKVGEDLVIFTRYQTYLLTGTDETNFTLRQVSSNIGCLDSRSITPYNTAPQAFLAAQDGCFFMSDRGLFYFDGYRMNDVTQGKPGHGIRTAYRSSQLLFANDTPRSQQMTTIVPQTEYLIMTAQDNNTNVANDVDSYMFHIPTGAWVRFGNTANYCQPFVYTKPPYHLNNRAMALTRTGLVELNSMFESEFPNTGSPAFDQYYDSSFVAQSADILSTIQFKDMELFNGDTGRLHQLYVEHSQWYNTASDPAMVGWNISVSSDPNLDSLTSVGALQPRWVGNVADSAGLYQKYFTTAYIDTPWPQEGSTFRLLFTTVGTGPTTHRPLGQKLFQVRAMVEKTITGRVDNAVTS